MIRNYIKIAWRNIRKSKLLNGIHIFGLSLAISTATLLYLTAMFELSFDDFHEGKERIGLVYFKTQPENGLRYSSTVSTPFAPMLKTALPDIERISRYYNAGIILRQGDKLFEANNKFVDADFLSIFSFQMLAGDQQALESLDNIVLDEVMANNLFNNTDVIGKDVEVYVNGEWESKTVSAVVETPPSNSSLTFNTLLRFEQKPNYIAQINDWEHEDHAVFVKLTSSKIDDDAFTAAARPFMQLHYKNSNDMLKRDGGLADKNGDYISLHLLPLDRYHLNNLGLGNGSSPLFPWILLLIAGLILFIACSNFINLSLANSLARNKEIGTRKTLGGSTWQLVSQLWTESFLLCLIALAIGLGFAWVILKEYNAHMNYQLTILQLFTSTNLSVFLPVFCVVTLIAGGYPAWRIARINIIQTLKGTAGIKSGLMRNGLSILQFSIAIVLIVATIVVSSQLNFLSNRPLGFNKSEVISIPIGNGIDAERALSQMRIELAAQPWVSGVSASDINIGRGRDGNVVTSRFGFDYEGRQIYTNFMRVDYDYLKTLGIKLIAGRDFDRAFSTDTAAVLINKQMAEQLGGVANSLGKNIEIDGNPQVIGVVDDFNFQDLRNKVNPLTLSMNPNIFSIAYIFVRVNTDNLAATIQQVERSWKKIKPKANVSPSYLDENTQNLYRNEQRFSRIVISAALIAIAISCLGLFALALLTINKRIKEIGIRKVLGSSVSSIVLLLSKDFVKLVMLAFVLAAPLSWWIMKGWLQNFAYHIDLQWWMLALAGLATIVTALLTISFKTIQAARANPVDSLRDE
ncbi:ABC transporter permease [Sphingobacterium sp. SGR-19]|uniref:ABC transporter permease n=1 Tax=Sphingobacterium sp. SGR-19 TaxID=2710886 RepID=UPI0013ED23F6|nr:ABC transporter permease [Sphingobacterium sp. SGR-19]NGM66427.1 FtsX-like permease family protein [Sphingobacterium sp. SGR-19]